MQKNAMMQSVLGLHVQTPKSRQTAEPRSADTHSMLPQRKRWGF